MTELIQESTSPSTSSIFSSTDGLGYTLQNNYRAAIRLNLNQYLWHESLGHYIHPSVPIPESNAAIADVATGTGIWLIKVARENPSAQLDGFDIDMTQAPHPAWLPGTIRLRNWDIFSPVPPDLEGKYDLVHVRLLVLVLSGVDLMPAIRNLLALLKPGGYLQWDEVDCMNSELKKVDDALEAPALEEIRTVLYANGRHNWVVQVPQILTKCGFEGARIDHYDEPPELVCAFNDLHMMVMEEFAGKLVLMGREESSRQIYALVQRGYEESLQGVALSIPRHVIVARKPLASWDKRDRSSRRPLESL